MRARNIKPNFFKNEVLASLPLLDRVLFVGLWCLADREGRLRCIYPLIKAELFPYGQRGIPASIKRLDGAGFILLYKTEKYGECIQIVNFEKHQHPHMKEPESTIPAPGNVSAEHYTSTIPARPLIDPLLLKMDVPLTGGPGNGGETDSLIAKQIEAQDTEAKLRKRLLNKKEEERPYSPF